MKKFKKKWFIIIGIVFLVLVWVLLTLFWTIPNWLNIPFIDPWNTIDFSKYDWKDENCSRKCYKDCERVKHEPFWYTCWNWCIWTCKEPKWNDCVSKCNLPDMWEQLGKNYTIGAYQSWCSSRNGGWTGIWALVNDDCYFIDFDKWLWGQKFYNEWVNEKFDWYQDVLKNYELCKSACGSNPSYSILMKPIIYLYPVEEENIHVSLWNSENLSHTYPKYDALKWRNVLAQPDWKLVNLENWRELYALYWEWLSNKKVDFSEWFVVAWKDIIPFLEKKLAILWLNEREAEEFIVYWLPQMENNEWNLIRFESKEEQDIVMPLDIEPKPDTVIRVMMDWKAIEQPIEIVEQKLYTPERSGFVVVEWGWTEIE